MKRPLLHALGRVFLFLGFFPFATPVLAENTNHFDGLPLTTERTRVDLLESAGADGDTCPERAFLQYFGKDRLMIGAAADDAFFAQNPDLADVRYLYLANAIFTGPEVPSRCTSADSRWWGCWQDFNQPPGQYLRDFLAKTENARQIPMITYYTFAQTSGRESQVSPANDVSFSTRYFNDWRFMLQQIGQRKVLLHVEPDLWGFAQHRNRQSPRNLPAAVRTANPADCGNIEDNFAGFSKCLISMVRKYAPNARVGLHASAWATGIDVNINRDTSLNIRDQAERVGNYLNALGADEADFLVVEALDRDADYYRVVRGENRWWNEDQTLPNFAQHFQWAKEVKSVVGKPLIWWQLPVGNVTLPNLPQQYKDNRVGYFLTHADDIVALGGVLMAFGAGASDQTNPLTDGGNLARRMSDYKRSSAGYGYSVCGVDPDSGSANAVVTGPLTAQTILGNLTPDSASLGKAGQVFVLLNLAPFTDQDGLVITTGYTLWTYSNDVLSLVVPGTIEQMCANAPAYYSGPLQVMQSMPLIPVATDLSLFAGSEAYIGYGKEEGLPAIQGAACMDMVTNGTVWLVHTLK